ncbi:hypothetical protein L7E55_07515 [Pelotomaculum isophthalicicum JI]|uniref:Uncharacterized protein n=1 Tax=Pelotomaculum isophthalicicum JI TaxID=947010 RepID=A0A9X4H563_9FIRM|nr:hypothetical protein [Pelotomaculum isophthalicicum]MDF9408207.1 hypothetical protein [Pelotomaculum isophthalicicum JI]
MLAIHAALPAIVTAAKHRVPPARNMKLYTVNLNPAFPNAANRSTSLTAITRDILNNQLSAHQPGNRPAQPAIVNLSKNLSHLNQPPFLYANQLRRAVSRAGGRKKIFLTKKQGARRLKIFLERTLDTAR